MNDGGPLTIAVVCEADADQRTACLLADRVACEQVGWLVPESLDSARCWRGVSEADSFLPWKAVRREADRRSVVVHGHFSGEPGAPDARAARRALFVVKKAVPHLAAVFLIRDSDNDLQRRQGLNQARDCARWPFEIVIGVAHAKRECWLLAAFCPQGDEEQSGHAAVRSELGLDPCLQSHELVAQAETAKRNAKRVLGTLCPDGGERGLRETRLDVLKERGGGNGLAEYLAELESRYVPLLGCTRSR